MIPTGNNNNNNKQNNMKLKQLLVAILATLFILPAAAQVRIGSSSAPEKGALLDLSSTTYIGGLKLPNVTITDLGKIPASFTEATVAGQDVVLALKGLMVYNVTASSGIETGVYVWDGDNWIIAKDTRNLDDCDSKLITVSGGSLFQQLQANTAMQGVTFTSPGAAISVTGNYSGINITGNNTAAVTVSGTPTAVGSVVFTATTNPTNCSGGTRTLTLDVTAQCNAISISSPATATTYQVAKDSKITLSISATGSDLKYQWYQGAVGSGTPLTGETNSTLTRTPTAIGAINYYCVVSQSCSSSTVNSVQLTVNCVDPSSITEAATTYYLTGTPTCFDVYRTFDASRGLSTARSDAFATTKTFTYTFNDGGSSYSGLSFVASGGSDIIKSLTWSGNVATLTFTDDVNSKIAGSTQTGTEIILYALFKNNLGTNVQKNLKLSVKDWQCCGANGTAGTLVVGSNSYLTHQYVTADDGVSNQCWMVSNSKEGTFSSSTYGSTNKNQNPSANGYYYTYTQAATACPTGWRIPTTAEWTKLKTIVNGNLAASQAKWWVTAAGSAFAGNAASSGGYWDVQGSDGDWWSSTTASSYFIARPSGMVGENSDDYAYWFSVRCVQN